MDLTVSVVISAYNRPDYLKKALQSVLTQTYPIYEIIVVDDFSPVNLSLVIEGFENAKIIYEKSKRNHGANHSRNVGARLAKGNWVAYLDDDDVWLEDKISKQVQSVLKYESIASLTSYRFLESGRIHAPNVTQFVEEQVLKKGNPYCGVSGLFVKKDLLLSTLFDEKLSNGQDWDIFIRLSHQGAICYLNSPLFLYRRGSHSGITIKAKNMTIDEYPVRLRAIKKHKAWLGEGRYKKRVSRQILAHLIHKPNPLSWVKYSIKEAGLFFTCWVMIESLFKKSLEMSK